MFWCKPSLLGMSQVDPIVHSSIWRSTLPLHCLDQIRHTLIADGCEMPKHQPEATIATLVNVLGDDVGRRGPREKLGYQHTDLEWKIYSTEVVQETRTTQSLGRHTLPCRLSAVRPEGVISPRSRGQVIEDEAKWCWGESNPGQTAVARL